MNQNPNSIQFPNRKTANPRQITPNSHHITQGMKWEKGNQTKDSITNLEKIIKIEAERGDEIERMGFGCGSCNIGTTIAELEPEKIQIFLFGFLYI